jgi:hypothetical protein
VSVRVHPQVTANVSVEIIDAEGDERAIEAARAAEERAIADAALEAATKLEAAESSGTAPQETADDAERAAEVPAADVTAEA